MKRLIILTLLASSIIIPAVMGEAASVKPQDLLKMGYEGIESNLTPAAKYMSGASALSVEGKDYRLGQKKSDALREFGSRSPQLQAGAAAALVPFRSPSPHFSRNMLITRDLGNVPFQTEPHLAVNPLDPEHLIVGVIDYNAPNVVSYVSIDGGATWDGPFQPRYLENDLGAGGDPVVAFDRNGKAYIAAISIGFEEFSIFGIPFAETVSSIAVSTSDDGGFTWSRPVSSARSRIDLQMQFTGQSGVVGSLALGFLDKPWMTVGPDSEDPAKDAVYVTYTHFVVRYEIVSFLEGGLFGFQN
ncbi:MAG: sialidase family protein, partial [Nitrososphaerales archaeon]